MSAITKEWLQQKIADMEAARDEIPFGLDEYDSNTLAAMKLALASLEAEKSILYRERNPYNGLTTGWQELTVDEFAFIKDNAGENAEFRTVYTAPPATPATVSVPDELTREEYKRRFMEENNFDDTFRGGWNACRSAMLNQEKGNG